MKAFAFFAQCYRPNIKVAHYDLQMILKNLTRKPIAIASDHRGWVRKEYLKGWLSQSGYGVTDCGAEAASPRVDAMDYAILLAKEISSGRSEFAVGICGSGQMMAITGNRYSFIRATVIRTREESIGAREHGDANMLVLGADITDEIASKQILEAFLTTEALGGRYAKRLIRLANFDFSPQ